MIHRIPFSSLLFICFVASPVRADEWEVLFDGTSLDQWKANITPDSFRLTDGVLRVHATSKRKAHLFFEGEDNLFCDFELKATVRAEPDSNGGIFFHTDESTRDQHMHLAKGYEVQLNSASRERRKTGSLYGIVDLEHSPVDETKWFEVGVSVKGKRIEVRINGEVVVDYTEPLNPNRKKSRKQRLLSKSGGKIALQAHDPNSVWYFREIKVRRL